MKILFLDIEGVMTKGMIGAARPMLAFLGVADTQYSRTASGYVRRLVEDHGCRIVLITRHGNNESEVLNHRLALAGVLSEWLYKPDPDAIPDATQTKGDAICAWLARNRDINVMDTVALEDCPEQLAGYPAERIVAVNPATGLTKQDFGRALEIFGIEAAIPAPAGISRQSPQGLQVR